MNIIMVDDNQIDIMMMEEGMSFVDSNLKFKALEDGFEADAFFETDAFKRIDLIILDLNLPGLGGLELLDKIRRKKKNLKLPVLIFSTSGLEADIENSLKNGANAYLIKPSSHEHFSNLAQNIVSFWGSKHIAKN